jgi:hypothetical protein
VFQLMLISGLVIWIHDFFQNLWDFLYRLGLRAYPSEQNFCSDALQLKTSCPAVWPKIL